MIPSNLRHLIAPVARNHRARGLRTIEGFLLACLLDLALAGGLLAACWLIFGAWG